MNDDPALIAEYKRYPKKIWPAITKSINDEGVRDLEIYLRGTRMFMMLEADDSFSFEKKAEADRKNPNVQEWEELMWRFQKALPDARPGEKRLLMERIVLEKRWQTVRATFWAAKAPKVLSFLAGRLLTMKSKPAPALFVELVVTPR